MRIVYDSDSMAVTEDIIQHLRFFGFDREAEWIVNTRTEFEAEIPSLIAHGRDLLAKGEIIEALRLFSYDPSAVDHLNDYGRALLKLYRENPQRRDLEIRQVLETSLLAIESQDFPAKAPLNLLAALDVLFHLLVQPRRCYSEAQIAFSKSLGVQLHITDDNGLTTYGLREHEAATEEENLFWDLLDAVVRLWELEPLTDQGAETVGQATANEYINQGILRVASRFLTELRAERTAA